MGRQRCGLAIFREAWPAAAVPGGVLAIRRRCACAFMPLYISMRVYQSVCGLTRHAAAARPVQHGSLPLGGTGSPSRLSLHWWSPGGSGIACTATANHTVPSNYLIFSRSWPRPANRNEVTTTLWAR